MRTHHLERLLSSLFLALVFTACTGPTTPEVVKNPQFSLDEQQEIKRVSRIAGDKLNTLWRMEAQYLDESGKPLSTTKVEVVLVAGDWTSDLAPISPTPGWTAFRNPGEFGDGAPDLIGALNLSPVPLYMRPSQRITPLNQTDSIPVPPGAAGLRARVLEVCPLEIRYLQQTNRRPMGDVIAIRTKKEEMRWREFRITGPCSSPKRVSYDY